jgi:RNA polymerase sigma-70 factor (ECF subfamily)
MAKREDYHRLVLPHLPAAYNLARWLMRHPQDAEDAVQEAFLRAWRSFDGFAGRDATSWILAIVRNTCLSALAREARRSNVVRLDGTGRHDGDASTVRDPARPPDEQVHERLEARTLHAAMTRLPEALREVLVLRELEGLAYAQIAAVVGTPIGTVMSRLSRARGRLRQLLEQNGHGDDQRREL